MTAETVTIGRRRAVDDHPSLLDASREDAEHSIDVRDFEDLAAAGRSRRTRLHPVIGAVAACALAASGILVSSYARPYRPDPPHDSSDTSVVTPYPELSMTTLDAGTYAFRPFADPALPEVRFTLPAGWNAWAGPNRFAGLDRAAPEDATAHQDVRESEPAWIVGMIPVDPRWIAQPGCRMVDVTGADLETVVHALIGAPRVRVTWLPQRTTVSGHPAVHLRLREGSTRGTCAPATMMRARDIGLRYLGRGTTYDVRVVDVGGRTLLLWSVWTAATPRSRTRDLFTGMHSVEVHDR